MFSIFNVIMICAIGGMVLLFFVAHFASHPVVCCVIFYTCVLIFANGLVFKTIYSYIFNCLYLYGFVGGGVASG